jgi:hypothetical protein
MKLISAGNQKLNSYETNSPQSIKKVDKYNCELHYQVLVPLIMNLLKFNLTQIILPHLYDGYMSQLLMGMFKHPISKHK